MVRSRWAALALACCTLFVSGCGNWSEGGWFGRFRNTSRTMDCDCSETSLASPLDSGFEGGPLLTPPDSATLIHPTTPILTAPPPRIVPIPHAAPMPYSPTH